MSSTSMHGSHRMEPASSAAAAEAAVVAEAGTMLQTIDPNLQGDKTELRWNATESAQHAARPLLPE